MTVAHVFAACRPRPRKNLRTDLSPTWVQDRTNTTQNEDLADPAAPANNRGNGSRRGASSCGAVDRPPLASALGRFPGAAVCQLWIQGRPRPVFTRWKVACACVERVDGQPSG